MQGMTITAQGPATVVLTNGDTPYSIKADVNAITGAYAPGRRATLLGDVLTLLSGVKGGSLAIDVKQVNGQMQGMFNFFFWR
jgi:predicted anti-sigma-YlaC factor YlaD